MRTTFRPGIVEFGTVCGHRHMRHGIDTAPKDGRAILLGDGARYLVAKWSERAAAWVTEEGQPGEITPTHWHDLSNDIFKIESEKKVVRAPRMRRSVSFLVALACMVTAAGIYREDLISFAAPFGLGKNIDVPAASTSGHSIIASDIRVETSTPPDEVQGKIQQAKLESDENENVASPIPVASYGKAATNENQDSPGRVSQVEMLPVAAEAPIPKVSNPERDEKDRQQLNQELVDAQNQLADHIASSRRELEQERARSAALERELAAERQRKASGRSASDNPQDLKDSANASRDSDGRSIEEERTAALEISKIKALLDAVSGEASPRQGSEEQANQPEVATTAQQDGGSSYPPAAPNKVIEESRATLPD